MSQKDVDLFWSVAVTWNWPLGGARREQWVWATHSMQMKFEPKASVRCRHRTDAFGSNFICIECVAHTNCSRRAPTSGHFHVTATLQKRTPTIRDINYH